MSSPAHFRRENSSSLTEAASPAKFDAVYNERGVIAETYYDLQGLAVLDAIRAAHPLPKASPESLCRALFQAVEIAVLNLNDVLRRAIDNLRDEAIDRAVVKLHWARGFHRVLGGLSLLPARLSGMLEGAQTRGAVRIADSPAFAEYFGTLQQMDAVVHSLIRSGVLNPAAAIANESLESVAFNLFHLLRICNHETTIWEENLAAVAAPIEIHS